MIGLEEVLDEAIRATGAERGFVILAADQLKFLAARNAEGANLKAHPTGVSRTIIGQVLESGKPMLAHDSGDDTAIDPRLSVRILGLRALLCAPFAWEGVILGVLYLDSSCPDVFGEGDLAAIDAFAERVAALVG
jgi:GAF domain-containing protein